MLFTGITGAGAANAAPEDISASISLKVPGNDAKQYPLALQKMQGWYVQLPGFGNVAVGHHPPGGGQGWQTAHYRHTQGAGKCVFQLRGIDKDRLQAFGLPVLHAGLLVSPQPAFAEGSSFFPHIGQLAGA